jgi:uncharacterized membrane protein
MLVMVPREQVIVLNMSVTDGFKLIISGGAVVPPLRASRDAMNAGGKSIDSEVASQSGRPVQS